MPQVERTVEIDAPVETVFKFIAQQPERQPEWWPPMELSQRVTPPPTAVGSVSRYVYNMLGIKIKGEHKVIELVENQRLVVQTISGINSTFEFMFKPIASGTRLSVRVDYTMPGSVIGQLLNRVVIEKKNESDLETGLAQLKTLIEAEI